MTREETMRDVVNACGEVFSPSGEINENSYLRSDLGADDLDGIELIMYLERKFSISISTDEEDNIHTIGDLVAVIIKKLP